MAYLSTQATNSNNLRDAQRRESKIDNSPSSERELLRRLHLIHSAMRQTIRRCALR